MITILTATYNRKEDLKKLYKSLVKQTNHKFQWLIIDDGSSDYTKEIVKNFDKAEFEIEYYYKENGGKHTALNYSHQYIKGDWTFVVDSDDILTENAIALVYKYIEKYGNRKDIGSFAFLKSDYSGKILAPQLYRNDYISNVIDYRINKNIKGDQAEVYRTDIFRKFKFPIFRGEKFLGEDYLHINAAYVSNTVYINKVIYLAEYRADGLTKAGRLLRIKNPLGGMIHGSLYFSERFRLKYRVKGMMLYICYGLFAKKSLNIMFKESNQYKILFFSNLLLGILLYFYWENKYIRLKN